MRRAYYKSFHGNIATDDYFFEKFKYVMWEEDVMLTGCEFTFFITWSYASVE